MFNILDCLSDLDLYNLINECQIELARRKDKITNLPSLDEEEIELLKSGQKIAAIRQYRHRVNCGLKEAKNKVEEYK